MDKKKENLRTLILVVSAALFVVLLVSVFAFFANNRSSGDGVTLPPDDWQTEDLTALSGNFVTVTPDNAADVVSSLTRPGSYRQTLSMTTYSGQSSSRQTTELWVCDGVWKIAVAAGGQTKHILTDGITAHLWYQDDSRRVRSVTLPQDMTPDDLAGIMTYETIGNLAATEILRAEYCQPEDLDGVPCLFVASMNDAGLETRFWVDLSTGLLCKAESLQGENTVFRLVQTELVMMDRTDEALQSHLLLPDKSNPFTS